MKTVNVEQALAAIGPDRKIAASPGCGAPTTLLAAIGAAPGAIQGSCLYSGLILGEYPFIDAVVEGVISYATWHVMPPIRRHVANGTVPFYPVRASQVARLLGHLGIDVALIRVTPPDKHGFCNLGPSVSYPAVAARMAGLVVAEIDETLPRVNGEAAIHVSDIDFAVDSTTPMPEYRRAEPDDTSRAIAKHILELLPPSPMLQIGIGAIPEALLDELATFGVEEIRFAGMAVDGVADLYDAGVLARAPLHPYPPVIAAELMGSRRLMDFADANPVLGNYSSSIGIDVSLGGFDRFVSINSAIEIDRLGQVNSEFVAGRQLSGIGGSVDFFEAASSSTDGMKIIAMGAVNLRDASSKIVGQLSADAPVTIPRHGVEYVVTEYGVANLAVASVAERAELLAAIAEPEHREAILGGAMAL